MRSQIDCYHPNLPRKVFEIKTRGTLGIRMNVEHYSHFSEYKLSKYHGFYNSFEREYYDMARSAFLKYNFQTRIGKMDGFHYSLYYFIFIFILIYYFYFFIYLKLF